MGYNTNPGLIYNNVDLLRKIKEAVQSGQEIRFKTEGDIDSEHYKLRRILAATDRHRSAHGGDFAGLGASVSIKVDAERSLLILRPRTGVRIEEYRPDEQFALEALEEAIGSLTLLEFWPTKQFKFSEFQAMAARRGWTIVESTMSKGEDGKLTVAAEKNDQVGDVGFNLLG